jgi:hypothetical protein
LISDAGRLIWELCGRRSYSKQLRLLNEGQRGTWKHKVDSTSGVWDRITFNIKCRKELTFRLLELRESLAILAIA